MNPSLPQSLIRAASHSVWWRLLGYPLLFGWLVASNGFAVSPDQAETKHVSIHAQINVLGIRPQQLTAMRDMPQAVQVAMQNCVRISCQLNEPNMTAHGSGTMIDSTHAATAGHVVDDSTAVWVSTGGRRYSARVVSRDHNADICVLETDQPIPGMTGAEILDKQVGKGERLYCSGFDQNGFRSWTVTVTGFFASPAIESHGGARGGSIQGNSGGGIFTASGRLCSVLYANGGTPDDTRTGSGSVISVEPSLTRRFLLPWRNRRARRNAQICPPGGCPPGTQFSAPIQQYDQSPRVAVAPQQPYCPPTNPPTDPCINCPPGADGQQGPIGDTGPQGEVGPPGDPGDIDYDLLVQEVLDRLPPMILDVVGPGGVETTTSAPLGGRLRLKMLAVEQKVN